MSAITPQSPMPADSSSPSGMLTTSARYVRLQASCSAGSADLYLIQKNEGGKWFKTGAVLRLDSAVDEKAAGQVLVENHVPATAFHVLQERGGTCLVYLAEQNSTTDVTTLSATTLSASGNASVGGTLGVTGAATLSSTLAVTGASTLTGAVTLGADMAAGSHKITGLSAGSAAGHSLRWEQGGMLAGALSTGTIGAATKYMNRGAATVAASAVAIATVTRAGILRSLYANLLAAPGGSDTVAFTIQKSSDNGGTWSDTTLTCTVTGSAKGNSDTTHAPSVAAGDLLAVKMVSSATTAADPSVGFEIL